MKAATRLALPLLALALSGCQSIFGNLFKKDYWDQIHAESDKDEEARLRNDPTTTFFLGIRTSAREVPFQIGIVVSNVYAEGPAARAGLRAGDEIRRINLATVRTPGEARLELTRLFKESRERIELMRRAALAHDDDQPVVPTSDVRVTFFRDGRQVESDVRLTTREGYLDLRRRRVLDQSHYVERGTNGFYFLKTRTLAPEFVDDYFGVAPPSAVLVAQDRDILPLAFGISLLRIEDIPIADATRVTVFSTLFQFSHRGTDVARTLEDLIPAVPPGMTDL